VGMGLRKLYLFCFASVVLYAGLAFGIDSYAIESASPDSFKAVSPELAPGLDPHGIRLFSYVTGKKTAICNVWWRAAVPTQTATGSPTDTVYGNLRVGELLGVVQYLVPTEDFQHHLVKPGLYSMRYAQLDQDGSDHALSPFRDFAVLSPIWADHHSNDLVPIEQLVKRSRFVTHEDGPAVLSLVPVNPAYKKFPSAVSDDRGFCVIQALLSVQKGTRKVEMPLALIMVRPPYENEGS
jgi:hypothetical protein